MVRKCLPGQCWEMQRLFARGENKGGLLSLWCLCPESGEWCCRMAGWGWGSKGSRKAETRRRQIKGAGSGDDLKDPQFSGKSSVAKRHRQLEAHGHSAPRLSTCYSGGKEEHGHRGKGLERWRQRDRNKQDMEMYRTWDRKGTQMQMQRGKQKEWDGLAIYVCGYLLRMARP